MSKLLLVAFKYPPYAGVGGYRWSKLSKYLARFGHKIHVVTVGWGQHGPNTLLDDVQHPNITIHRIPSGYPHNLRYRVFSNRLVNHIKNGLFVHVLNRYLFYDDEAQHWGRYLLPYCESLLEKKDIRTVVATGAPFQANRWAAVLKRQMSQICLIQDFRDPWADNPLRNWPRSQESAVRSWQKMAVEEADCVVAVTEGLLKLYLDGTRQTVGTVISNGCDPESVTDHSISRYPKSGFSFIYIGDVNNLRAQPLIKFLEAVRSVRSQIHGIRVTLVGGYRKVPERLFPDLVQEGILELRPYVSQAIAFEMVKQHTYALQLNAKVYPYLVSTKIYEHGMLQVPTISLNYGGEIDALIRDHDLGYSIDVDHTDIAALLQRLYWEPPRQFLFDVESFYYDRLAKRYSRLIDG